MRVKVSEINWGRVGFVEYNSRDEDEESERDARSEFYDDEDEIDEWDDDDDNEEDDDEENDREDERENEISDSDEDDQDSEGTSESSSFQSEDDSEEEEEVRRLAHWYLKAEDARTVISHCLEVYHKSQLSSVTLLEEADRFDIDYLRQTLNGFNVVDLSITMDMAEDHQFAHQVVSINIPAKKLNASAFIFENKESLHKALIQNYDAISLEDPLVRNQGMILDDLLMINSPYIEIENALISDKDLNRFIKHWICGSNSRMKYMFLSRSGLVGFNKEIILKGIDHQELPAGVVREVNVTCFEGFRVVRVPSGFNFTRHDLTEATIRMKNKRGRAALEFIVWD